MSAETVKSTDMSEFEARLRARTVHRYPRDPRYRLSGSPVPEIGDVAYCGHIKNIPQSEYNGEPLSCVACARLQRIAERR